MNTPNNKRRRKSQEKIEKVFVQLLQKKEVNKISITDICKLAQINRSTFYSNYIDIYDLVEHLGKNMMDNFWKLYKHEKEHKRSSHNFLKLFKNIKENQIFYKTYFKLGLDVDVVFEYDTELATKYYNNNYIDYHTLFFKAGITAVIKKWLNSDCKETPEEIMQIINEEYNKKI